MTMTKYFDDQPIVKGADVIYRPAGNAGEYAPLATNPYRGCGHECLYCYVPLATKIDRSFFNEGAILRNDYFGRLAKDCERYRRAGVYNRHPADQVFITFSSDPYHHGDTLPTAATMLMLREHGMAYCTLTKGGHRSLRYMHLYRRERDAYAATLTTLDDRFSMKWERRASLPQERLDALAKFHEAGIFTWVSLEPTLDVEASMEIVKATCSFVDLYKIGKANYLKEITRTTDWRDYTLRMVDLLTRLDKRFYIKRDLQEWLPAGVANPLRVSQHH